MNEQVLKELKEWMNNRINSCWVKGGDPELTFQQNLKVVIDKIAEIEDRVNSKYRNLRLVK